ncbi:MAG: hypothetical protein SGJ15_01435 [Bacteroidota bacterium]|nr:hypothetical protein [Bacteroidota bacterium]
MKAKVYVRKARTFGEIFGDTIGYMRQNFKSLFGSILLLVSPFVLGATVLITFLFKGMFANITSAANDIMGFYASMAGTLLLMTLLSLLGYTAFVTVLNEHMLLNDSLPENEKPQIKDILKNFFGQFLRGLGAMFILVILSLVFGLIIALVFGLMALLIKISAVLGILLFILVYIFFLLIVMPIVLYFYTAILFTSQRHRINVFEAIGKVFKNFKGNFWITWSLSFLCGLITYILSFIVFLPSYIVFIISFFTRMNRNLDDMQNSQAGYDVPIYIIVLFSISGLLIACVYAIYFIMMNLQCASLEEKKEGISILEKIESI